MNREAAAAFLGLDARTVYARYRAGDIPAIRVGRVLRFDRAQLTAWKERQTVNSSDSLASGDALPAPRTTTERLIHEQIREQRATNALLRVLVERTA